MAARITDYSQTGEPAFDVLAAVFARAKIDAENGYDPLMDKTLSRKDALMIADAKVFLFEALGERAGILLEGES